MQPHASVEGVSRRGSGDQRFTLARAAEEGLDLHRRLAEVHRREALVRRPAPRGGSDRPSGPVEESAHARFEAGRVRRHPAGGVHERRKATGSGLNF